MGGVTTLSHNLATIYGARKPTALAVAPRGFPIAPLRQFIEYKAALAGVPVVAVDPRNTSRTCPCCGHADKANRKTQDQFLCMDCGYSGLADHIAAWNIARRAAVNPPYVSGVDVNFHLQRQGQAHVL
jgi:hypothetical protein